MSEEIIKKVLSEIEKCPVSEIRKCHLVISDSNTVIIECPTKEAVVEITKTVAKDGVLIREVKVQVEKGDK